MASGMRQPFPWETSGPTRQSAGELDERETVESTETRTAAKLVSVPTAGRDKGRQGAEGAAAWVHREMQKIGIDQPLHEVRERVNRARTVTAAKRRR